MELLLEMPERKGLMQNPSARLHHLMVEDGFTQAELAERVDRSPGLISSYMKPENKISDIFLRLVEDELGWSSRWIRTGEGAKRIGVSPEKKDSAEYLHPGNLRYTLPGDREQPFVNEAEPIELNPDGEVHKNWRGNEFVDLPGGMVMMSVPLVDEFAYAGYLSGWKDPVFLSELPKFSFITQKRHGGKYMAFEVRGDSMDDNTRDAICEGDTVLCRAVDKHFWNSKFHLHRFEDYVIVHQEGIITKRIVAHDVEQGIITCASTNPNKDLYPDLQIKLEEVYELYNIVRVTRERRRR